MWKEGAMRVRNSVFKFWVKYFDEGSCFGIDEGSNFKTKTGEKRHNGMQL